MNNSELMLNTPFMRALYINDIDFAVVSGKKVRKPMMVQTLCDFLINEFSQLDSISMISGRHNFVSIWWQASFDTKLLSKVDLYQSSYVMHLITVGLYKNPINMIANIVYTGRLLILGHVLLQHLEKNLYMALKDAKLMAMVAPYSAFALSVYGMILLRSGQVREAWMQFSKALSLDPNEFLACKYGAIACTLLYPCRAVKLAEESLNILTKKNLLIDDHMRCVYGMALLANGCKVEAATQFALVKYNISGMTPDEWVNGGYFSCLGDNVSGTDSFSNLL